MEKTFTPSKADKPTVTSLVLVIVAAIIAAAFLLKIIPCITEFIHQVNTFSPTSLLR